MDKLPVQTGTYTLFLALPTPKTLIIGRLGRFEFPPGIYAYQGSAWGPGGLRGRLGRHLKGSERKHWHIDHLRSVTEVKGYGYLIADTGVRPVPPTECTWSQDLVALPGASIPVPGFGASDCTSGCLAHLVYFLDPEPLERISPVLGRPIFVMR